jgi:hypothetical protein
MKPPLYGLMAEFASAGALLAAARQARAAGFRRLDAFAPYPIAELPEALELPSSHIPLFMLGGGILGALAGYGMQYYATVISYPMDIGGRPLPSWPALIPVTFELTIFGAALAGLGALLFTLRLPKVYHPVFNHPDFRRASQDGFFLCIHAGDAQFEMQRTADFLATLQPISVEAVKR